MKIRLHLDDVEWHCTLPHKGAPSVEAAAPACACGSVWVRGLGDDERGHDTITTRAVCAGCGARRGKLVVTVDTLFGIEEDERVMNGRCRVY